MAVVFSGTDRNTGRRVAIKVLKPEYRHVGVLVARFQREARIASGFEHPHVNRIFDYGTTTDGLQFMAMPFLEGSELSNSLGKPFAPSQAVDVARQVVVALEHVHGRNIIHRDVKPENLFVTPGQGRHDVVKLVDFGVAKELADSGTNEGTLTLAGVVVGTPTHIAPEQAMGLDVDGRADLYALGVTLYELLSGRLPFDDEDPNILLRRHVKEPAPELPRSVPAPLRSVVAKLLAKRPEDRFENATVVAVALHEMAHLLVRDPTPWRNLVDAASAAARGRASTASGNTVAWQAKGRTTRMNEALEQIISGRQTTSDLLTDLLGCLSDDDATP
jgi:serine/threonine-protein kinase